MGCLPSKPKRKHHLRDNFVVERNKSVEDDYKIIKQIGKGSIGVIYLAECRPPKYVDDCSLCAGRSLHGGSDSQHSRQLPLRKGFQRQYAIKEIDASMIDERAFDSLITEIRLLKTLDHPFIIKVFGSYTEIIGDREKLSVVMELCKGGALDKYVPYKEETASVLVANVIEAVLYLHNHNVIHRDLKNENVMFADETRDPNNIRLLDFGLAKVFSRSQPIRDRAGTIYSMSPEALRGEYTEKADMWSIGVMTYHLLSGKRPFWGESKHEIAQKVTAARYSMVGPKWDKISREAKSFIRNMLQFDPILRYHPVEALKSPWLRQHTECNLRTLSNDELGVLKIVQESNAPQKEMERLALYAIAQKARSEDMQKLRQLYLAIPKGKDGVITLPSMKKALQGQLEEAKIEEWFHRADIDDSGSINFTEFVASSFGAQSQLSVQDILDAFRVFDRDDSGFITAANLREALQTDEGEYIDMLIKEADEQGDGQISFKDFCNLLMKNKLTAPSQGG